MACARDRDLGPRAARAAPYRAARRVPLPLRGCRVSDPSAGFGMGSGNSASSSAARRWRRIRYLSRDPVRQRGRAGLIDSGSRLNLSLSVTVLARAPADRYGLPPRSVPKRWPMMFSSVSRSHRAAADVLGKRSAPRRPICRIRLRAHGPQIDATGGAVDGNRPCCRNVLRRKANVLARQIARRWQCRALGITWLLPSARPRGSAGSGRPADKVCPFARDG